MLSIEDMLITLPYPAHLPFINVTLISDFTQISWEVPLINHTVLAVLHPAKGTTLPCPLCLPKPLQVEHRCRWCSICIYLNVECCHVSAEFCWSLLHCCMNTDLPMITTMWKEFLLMCAGVFVLKVSPALRIVKIMYFSLLFLFICTIYQSPSTPSCICVWAYICLCVCVCLWSCVCVCMNLSALQGGPGIRGMRGSQGEAGSTVSWNCHAHHTSLHHITLERPPMRAGFRLQGLSLSFR